MDVNGVVSLVQGVGFPIAVTIWLLVRTDKREEQTREALRAVERAVDRLCLRLGEEVRFSASAQGKE